LKSWRTRRISKTQAVATKSTPQRTCVGCRQIKAKQEMVRLVRTREGDIEIDATGKKEGRGAYICPDPDCWEKALTGKQLERTLRGSLSGDKREQLIRNGKDLLKELNGAQSQ